MNDKVLEIEGNNDNKWARTAFFTAILVLSFTFFIFPFVIGGIPFTRTLFMQLGKTWQVFIASVPHQLMMLASIPVAAILSRKNIPAGDFIGFKNWRFSYFIYVPAVELLLFPIVALSIAVFKLFLSIFNIVPPEPILLKMLQNCNNESFLIIAASATLIAPIAEEIIFRYAIFNYLQIRMGTILAAVTTSMLFAAIHMDILQLPGIFILGLTFQLMYIHFKSIYPCIMIHILHNSVSLALFLIISRILKLVPPA